VNQSVLLQVAFGGNQYGFAVIVFNAGQLHAHVTNEIGAVEDVADLGFQEFIHRSICSFRDVMSCAKQRAIVIPKPVLSTRNLLSAGAATADSSRDHTALGMTSCGAFKRQQI
jgi:hypothetical protein